MSWLTSIPGHVPQRSRMIVGERSPPNGQALARRQFQAGGADNLLDLYARHRNGCLCAVVAAFLEYCRAGGRLVLATGIPTVPGSHCRDGEPVPGRSTSINRTSLHRSPAHNAVFYAPRVRNSYPWIGIPNRRSVSTSANSADPSDSLKVARHRCAEEIATTRTEPLGPNGCQFGCPGPKVARQPYPGQATPS
jgi:hypothetical protein